MNLSVLWLVSWLALVNVLNADDSQSDREFGNEFETGEPSAILEADDSISSDEIESSGEMTVKVRATAGDFKFGQPVVRLAVGMGPALPWYKKDSGRCKNGRCNRGKGSGIKKNGGKASVRRKDLNDPYSDNEMRKFLKRLMMASSHFNDEEIGEDDAKEERGVDPAYIPGKGFSLYEAPKPSSEKGQKDTLSHGVGKTRPNRKDDKQVKCRGPQCRNKVETNELEIEGVSGFGNGRLANAENGEFGTAGNRELGNAENREIGNLGNGNLGNSGNRELDNAGNRELNNARNNEIDNAGNTELGNARNKEIGNRGNKNLGDAGNRELGSVGNKEFGNVRNKEIGKTGNVGIGVGNNGIGVGNGGIGVGNGGIGVGNNGIGIGVQNGINGIGNKGGEIRNKKEGIKIKKDEIKNAIGAADRPNGKSANAINGEKTKRGLGKANKGEVKNRDEFGNIKERKIETAGGNGDVNEQKVVNGDKSREKVKHGNEAVHGKKAENLEKNRPGNKLGNRKKETPNGDETGNKSGNKAVNEGGTKSENGEGVSMRNKEGNTSKKINENAARDAKDNRGGGDGNGAAISTRSGVSSKAKNVSKESNNQCKAKY